MIGLRLLLALLLCAIPIGWIATHTGVRRRRAQEGRIDSALLLLSVVSCAFALTMAGASVVRERREQREIDRSKPIVARIESCRVTAVGTGRREWHKLVCTLRYRDSGGEFTQDVQAGYPRSRAPYEEWMRRHPSGSELQLRLDPGRGERLFGLSHIAPSTTTAFAAAGAALTLAVAAVLLFGVSRAVVLSRSSGETSLRS